MGERDVDGAADVFALGATLLLAATGHPPYPAKSSPEAVYRLMTSEPDLSGLPEPLTAMVAGCLARDPADRPTPADLVAGLAPYLSGTGVTPPLPMEARAVIEEYRQMPLLQDPDHSWGSAWDKELDRFLGRPAPQEDPKSARTRIPRVVSHRGGPRRQKAGHYVIAGAILLAGAGITVGVVLTGQGGSASPTGATVNGAWASDRANAGAGANGLGPGGATSPAPQGSYYPPPPPGQGPPPNIHPALTMSQAQGTQSTVFVIQGSGWPPGQYVTISVTNGAASSNFIQIENDGTFSYPINQMHEFFSGKIPPGTYTAQAVSGPNLASTTFTVTK
jgi:serine/threonine protein kinase